MVVLEQETRNRNFSYLGQEFRIMKKKHLITLLLAVIFLGMQSCAQSVCSAYTKADDKPKQEKKEGRF